MEKLPQRIKQDVQDIHTFLMQWDLYTFTLEEKQDLVARSQKVLERLQRLSDQALTVGLLGGTGVGKSTLMNSLAGGEIASTSHRRPHTERVLLYRHDFDSLIGDHSAQVQRFFRASRCIDYGDLS